MKAIISSILLMISVIGCSTPRAPENATISKDKKAHLITIANECIEFHNLKWGEPVEVRWDPLDKAYFVIYLTPEDEIRVLGERSVFILAKDTAYLKPRM